MVNYLDDGVDELAAKSFDGLKIRLVLGVLVSGLATLIISPSTAAFWLVGCCAQESLSWVVSHRQGRGAVGSIRLRGAYLLSLLTGCTLWVFLGGLFWTSGSSEGAIVAVTLWLSVIFFTQANAYQSAIGFVVGGALPGIGMLVWVQIGPNPLHLNLGPVMGFLALALVFACDGVFRALAVRKKFNQAQEQLAASETKYRVLADNLTDIISMTGTLGEKIYVSPSLTKVLGYTPEAWFEGVRHQSLHPEDANWVREAVEDFVKIGGEMTQQYRVLHQDGRYVWMETNFSLVPAETDGELPKVLTVSRPIDARKALEKDLVDARRRAEDAAAAKSEFLANMTHELRTPLNAIIGFSEVLRRSTRLAKEDTRHVSLIHNASLALLELVTEILDYSKLEAGGVELEAHAFDPAAPPRAVLDLMAGQAEAKDVWTSLETEGDIRPLIGDDGKIRQVLLNLVSNGLKFTHAGGVKIRVVQLPLDETTDRLRVEVIDTGIGIPAHQIDHLFDRFTQADASVSRQYGGTGLGLAICRRTIERMGGDIGALSEPGKGSTFWFELTLPWTQALSEPALATETIETPDRPIRLLLVEDVAVNRELIQTLLRPFDIDIETAENGLEALKALDAQTFDLVFMDVHMPVLDGLSATRTYRDSKAPGAQTTPIVAMTANVLPDQISRCLAAGMDDHIGKPINPGNLLRAISKWSQGREVTSEDALATG